MNRISLHVEHPRSYRGGFTMIEILVVIAIIAILVAIVSLTGGGATEAAKIKQTKAVMAALTSAIDEYEGSQGHYPLVDTSNENLIDRLPGDPRQDHIHAVADISDEPVCGLDDATDTSCSTDTVYSVQALMYALQSDPDSQPTVNKLPGEFKEGRYLAGFALQSASWVIANAGGNPNTGTIALPTVTIVDSWGTPMCYHYNVNINNGIPYLWSAGPDKVWQSDDDIYSYKD